MYGEAARNKHASFKKSSPYMYSRAASDYRAQTSQATNPLSMPPQHTTSRALLLVLALRQLDLASAMGGGGGGERCDAMGADARYDEVLDLETSTRVVSTSGCPNHYSLCTGKPVTGCGGIGEEGTQTEARFTDAVFSIPTHPVFRANGATQDISCTPNTLAVARNGVGIYGPGVTFRPDPDNGRDCVWLDPEDDSAEWVSFDMCSGHGGPSGACECRPHSCEV